jgi:hypothetical protein
MWLNVVVDWLTLLIRIRKGLGSDLGPKLMHVGGGRLFVFKARGSTVVNADRVDAGSLASFC